MKITSLKKCIVHIVENIKRTLKRKVSALTNKTKPHIRKNSENMTDIEKMDAGFNGSTYSINGRDVDF